MVWRPCIRALYEAAGLTSESQARLRYCAPYKGLPSFAPLRKHQFIPEGKKSHEYYDDRMLDRNHRLVETAGLLLAVYNGERHGGTAATVQYAWKLGRKLVILNSTSLETVEEYNA